MFWNYRIIKHNVKAPFYAAVHEVYYDDAGNVETWTEDAITLTGSSKTAIAEDLKYIVMDIKQPILNESELLENLKKNKQPNL